MPGKWQALLLRFLKPDANRVTLFGPPGLSNPRQVAYHAGKVWFTDDPVTGTIGFVDPAVAERAARRTS